ncbi:UvrD-helicase domain-containing protein [Allorhodopirellula heiligendammensis]|uniref:DNA 3'-5' helicase n=1 Tax=Allorhodopirellula heiligendammensis TaxID=2714739 RepID=A0A5C6BEB7_9BACT|nr:UvrD-helicase domain-containing protein [Allorhodopirellula heiligendammensis]TWU10525.1 ATP-dependent helicase/nuclease subunit A [Allorhodopirellula heiligendammensis]
MSKPKKSKSKLELIRAGAGSGKTYNLCETVAAAVHGGLDPARIMATTFTKKAAAELKGRIQSKLLSGTDDATQNQLAADRLELAAIGTVHGVAHRVLSRYAVELGLSTRLEVMSEVAAKRLVSEQLNILPLDGWEQLVSCAHRLGITDLQKQILKLLDAKRSNQISDDELRQHLKDSGTRVCQLLSTRKPLLAESFDNFLELVQETLRDPAVQTCTTQDSIKIRQKLADLQSQRHGKWEAYAEVLAKGFKAGKRSGADGALTNLREHAVEVCNHQDLHDDVCRFSDLLAEHAILIETGCNRYKIERGLVDFTDLETLFLEALLGDQLPELIENDFSLVMVDEFQDTNPLQLAIFQAVRRISPRHRWVGDPKQAIFGFRGTDPALVSKVWEQFHDSELPPLPDNRRSQKGLVQFVGKIFEPIFGEDAKQNPVNEKSNRNIERWLFKTKNQSDDAKALVAGIRELQDEGYRLGDMVVLERANAGVAMLAVELERNGIEYLFENAGLLSTREGVLTMAGLRMVLDRNDSLAAATIKHFLSSPDATTPDWIIDRLTERKSDREADEDSSNENRIWKQPWGGDPDLTDLERIERKTSSPHSVCKLVLEALDLPNRIATWGDVAQRASNLDSILKHVANYEDQMVGSGQAATLGGAVLYLEQLANDDEDIKYPPLGHNAVTIMTYHKSKGLQWPVVILSGLNSDRGPNMWEPSVGGGGEDVNKPLDGRTIRAWTWPFGMTDAQPPKRRTGTSLDEDAVASPEGVEQANDEIAENLRLLYVGCTRAESKLIFAHRPGTDKWLQRLPNVDTILPVDKNPGEHSLAGIDTSYVVRHLTASDSTDATEVQSIHWFAKTDNASAVATPRFHSPSQIEAGEPDDRQLHMYEMAGDSHFPEGLDQEHYSAFGDAVHAYLAALPSLANADAARKTVIAGRCLSALAMDGKLAPSVLVEVGGRFVEWVKATFPGATWRVEVPAIAGREAGGSYRGTLDLILEMPDATIAIIDHKSAPIRRANCEPKARKYVAQLDAYNEMLRQQGCQIASSWIHFPLAGVMVNVE